MLSESGNIDGKNMTSNHESDVEVEVGKRIKAVRDSSDLEDQDAITVSKNEDNGSESATHSVSHEDQGKQAKFIAGDTSKTNLDWVSDKVIPTGKALCFSKKEQLLSRKNLGCVWKPFN